MMISILCPRSVKSESHRKIEDEIKRNVDKNPTEYIVEHLINEGYDRNEDQFCPKVLGFH